MKPFRKEQFSEQHSAQKLESAAVSQIQNHHARNELINLMNDGNEISLVGISKLATGDRQTDALFGRFSRSQEPNREGSSVWAANGLIATPYFSNSKVRTVSREC